MTIAEQQRPASGEVLIAEERIDGKILEAHFWENQDYPGYYHCITYELGAADEILATATIRPFRWGLGLASTCLEEAGFCAPSFRREPVADLDDKEDTRRDIVGSQDWPVAVPKPVAAPDPRQLRLL